MKSCNCPHGINTAGFINNMSGDSKTLKKVAVHILGSERKPCDIIIRNRKYIIIIEGSSLESRGIAPINKHITHWNPASTFQNPI